MTDEVRLHRVLAIWSRADAVDRRDGAIAYPTYRRMMVEFAEHYGIPLNRVVAAFCALSPNSDYIGNLRSLRSVLRGLQFGDPLGSITVSTYRACLLRAYRFASGAGDFLVETKGPKTRAFYDNILNPETSDRVTVDGHVSAIVRGMTDATMKTAIVKSLQEYRSCERAVTGAAAAVGVPPTTMQATIWLTRKRENRALFAPQLDLFRGSGLYIPLWDIQPYPSRLSP